MKSSISGKTLLLSTLSVALASFVSASEYTVPSAEEGFSPVSKWTKTIEASEAARYRANFSNEHWSQGDDIGAYAYLHFDEVMSTASLNRRGAIAEWEYDLTPEIANTTAKTKLGEITLAEAMADERSRLQAYMVIHKGKVAFEAYPGMEPGHKHLWNSATKTITSILVDQLVNEGRLDMDKTVGDYLPELKDRAFGEITIANLVHQRSGLDVIETQETVEDPNHPMGAMIRSAAASRGDDVKTLMEIFKSVEGNREDQGLVFDYSSVNTQVLGYIFEVIEGKTWDEIVSDRIWSQVGMANDGSVALSAASGDVLSPGGVSSTLHDFARFATAFTPSWNKVVAKPLISAGFYKNVYAACDNKDRYMAGPQGKRMSADFGEDSNIIGASYHYDAVFKDGDTFKAGLGGQGIYVSPETDTAIVWFSVTYRNSLGLAPYARQIIQKHYR